MARRFAKFSDDEIVVINEAAFFYPSDFVNTKTTIPLRVGDIYKRWISTSTSRLGRVSIINQETVRRKDSNTTETYIGLP